jgi:squalene-hopene/tetraprenyl-beta-curcumene cyclase
MASAARATGALFEKQHEDGHFCAELEGDSILNSEYLLMKAALGRFDAPGATSEERERFKKMGVYLRMLQREDGTWGQYAGSAPDISACVKAYFALKLLGDDRGAPHMIRARERILELGGAETINTFSMFYLACLGQVSWDACPTIPPEVVLLPRVSPFHLDKVSAWTRTMILPLAICTALRPVRRLPSHLGIGELFVDQTKRDRLWRETDDEWSWSGLFLKVDKALNLIGKARLSPVRGLAIQRAVEWLDERLDPNTTDGLGAIFPPMVYIQIAYRAIGRERGHPTLIEAERQLDRFIIETESHIRIQPCFSPVWDSGIALYALTEAGRTIENSAEVRRLCDWLLAREVSHVGDWVRNLRPEDRSMRMGPGGDAGAWAFEYKNDWYPDVDDTAMICKALVRATGMPADADTKYHRAARRGVRWLCAMQNDDGGWAAFDRTTHREWMEHVPFADHNAMQDPSCADITGRTIESLITCGVPADHPTIRKALAYLRGQQRESGAWWGRWGVNYIYGTWQATGGLAAAGETDNAPYLARTLTWLRGMQHDDGGWGESCDTYEADSVDGRAESTPSQTAWALLSMMHILGTRAAEDDAVIRGIGFLMDGQLDAEAAAEAPAHLVDEPAGAWREAPFTGTGFPRVFYLRYHLYRHYFPLIALSRFAILCSTTRRSHRS